MDVKLAINLLETTFKQKFNIDNFEYFLLELFNDDIDINITEEKQFIGGIYKKYVNNFYNIGNYRSKYDERIGVYAVELSNESSRDRARTMQRNLIADVMRKYHRLAETEGENSENYRSSV